MCNLTGYSGKTPVNVDKMKLLFIYGNRRGKDGFGVVIGKQAFKYCGYEKGTDNSNSENVVYGKLFNTTKYRHTIIAHNRARSVGNVNINNTHPFEYNSKGNTVFFAHNGTIQNIEDLAKIYNIKTYTGEVDSKILGNIIYEHGFDVLKEYVGYAAFSYLDYEEDALYIWKGLSQCDSVTPTVERPLSFWQNKTKTQLYYSSEAMTLATALNVPVEDIQEFEPNYLYKIKEGKIVSKTFYDRSAIEYKPKPKSIFGSGAWGDDWGYPLYKNTNNPKHTIPSAKYDPTVDDEKKSNGVESEKKTKNDLNVNLEYTKQLSPQQQANGIYFWKGRYYHNGHIVNGVWRHSHELSKVTQLFRQDWDATNFDFNNVYFFKEGYMIKDKEHYLKLEAAVNFHSWSIQSKQQYIHRSTIIVGSPWYGSMSTVITKHSGVVDDNYYIKPMFCDVYYYCKNGIVYVSKTLSYQTQPANE